MKKKMKMMIDPRTFNPYKFESFLEEVEQLGGVVRGGFGYTGVQ